MSEMQARRRSATATLDWLVPRPSCDADGAYPHHGVRGLDPEHSATAFQAAGDRVFEPLELR